MTPQDYRARAQSAREENRQLITDNKAFNPVTAHITQALIGINDARIILNELAATTLEQQAKAREIAED